MQVGRNTVILGLVLGGVFLALWPKRRAALAETLAAVRRRGSRRITDREARAGRLASEAWENEGGALPAVDARLR